MGTNMVLCSILFWPGCLACSPSHSYTVAAESTGLPICFKVDSEPVFVPSYSSLRAQWRGANWDTWNNPGIIGCHMQLYCFWFILLCYHSVPQHILMLLMNCRMPKALCPFWSCPFWSLSFVDKSNQEGHRNIVAECLASSLTKQSSQTAHFSHYVLEMSLASSNSSNCVFLVDHRGNDSLIWWSGKPKEIKWNDSQSPVIPVPFCSRLCIMHQRTT